MNNIRIENSIENEERDLIDKWVHLWGSSASEMALDSQCNFFFAPDIEGVIGYCIESDCAVVFGDPICHADDKPRLAEAFARYCNEQKLNMIYIIATQQFAAWAIKHICKIMLEVGEELIFLPEQNTKEGRKGYKLRNYIRHAGNLGLAVQEYLGHDDQLEQSMKNIGTLWQRARQGPQIYLGDLNFFEHRNGKRWFYVSQGEQVIAMALLSRLEAYQGWLLKYLITSTHSPRGTSELLMDAILNKLRIENCHYLTFGMVPANQMGEVIGLGKFSKWIAQRAYSISKWIFHLGQRKIFWQKFHPQTSPAYILLSHPHLGWNEIQALMKSFKINF